MSTLLPSRAPGQLEARPRHRLVLARSFPWPPPSRPGPPRAPRDRGHRGRARRVIPGRVPCAVRIVPGPCGGTAKYRDRDCSMPAAGSSFPPITPTARAHGPLPRIPTTESVDWLRSTFPSRAKRYRGSEGGALRSPCRYPRGTTTFVDMSTARPGAGRQGPGACRAGATLIDFPPPTTYRGRALAYPTIPQRWRAILSSGRVAPHPPTRNPRPWRGRALADRYGGPPHPSPDPAASSPRQERTSRHPPSTCAPSAVRARACCAPRHCSRLRRASLRTRRPVSPTAPSHMKIRRPGPRPQSCPNGFSFAGDRRASATTPRHVRGDADRGAAVPAVSAIPPGPVCRGPRDGHPGSRARSHGSRLGSLEAGTRRSGRDLAAPRLHPLYDASRTVSRPRERTCGRGREGRVVCATARSYPDEARGPCRAHRLRGQ